MLKNQNHVHKFKRHTYKSTGSAVFFCTDDKCNYKVDVALSLGKLNICNRCGNEFKMDNVAIRQTKPHCRDCDRRRVKDLDGSIRVVKPEILAKEIADSRVSSLSERLRSITEPDKDI